MSNRLLYIANMVFFGTTPLVIISIELSTPVIVQWRTLLGGLFLLLLSHLTKTPIDWQAIRSNWKGLLSSGLCLGLNWLVLYESYRVVPVGVAITICYAAPILVFVVSPFLFKTRSTRGEIIGIIAALVGVVLMNLTSLVDSGASLQILPILAALLYAGLLICGRFVHGVSGLDMSFVQMGIGFFVSSMYSLFRTGSVLTIFFRSFWWPLYTPGSVMWCFSTVCSTSTHRNLPSWAMWNRRRSWCCLLFFSKNVWSGFRSSVCSVSSAA